MEQLSGLDAAFVHQDSDRTPMHICAVLLYDVGDDQRNAISLDDLKQLAQGQLAHFPLFRRTLKRVPMGIDTPYWVDTPLPDWDQHISESSLRTGNWRELQTVLARLHGTQMNLTRPLWEMHLIHNVNDMLGLPPRCQALILKVHHSAIDGISLAAIISAMHQKPGVTPPTKNRLIEVPGLWELWTRANLRSVGRQFKLADTVRKLVPGFIRARETRRKFSDLPPVLGTRSRFNAPVKDGRNTGAALLPLSEVVAVKRAVRRVTLNDIAMSCVAGALREYLQGHRELPAKSLVGGIPVNLRSPADDSTGGNKTATMMVGLATNIADPVERLRLVHRYAVAGKKAIDALGSGTVMDISDSLTPGVLAEGIRTMAWASRVAEIPVPFHTMISNVPGPPDALYLGDAELVVPIGLGPVRDNMGLFHIVSNSESMMSLSFSACQKLLPDAALYERCLRNAWEALRERALSEA